MERFAPKPTIAKIRERLDHPVIDSDGHLMELQPVAMEYIARAAGVDVAKRIVEQQRSTSLSGEWYGLSQAERMSRWVRRPTFWFEPLRNHGLDLATATFPDLLARRLDQLGIDFAVLYPTMGINVQGYADEEVRRASCRGLNDYYADHWMGHPDRMTPVAVIPMHSPEEAVEELDYAVSRRGFKAVVLPSYVKRPITAVVAKAPAAARFAWRADTFGIDSEHDYDTVWARCRDLGVVAGFHGSGQGTTFHDSISNPVYNHVGHFAAAATAVSKSLFLGGVSQRFPELRFLFLEGGVGWARSLLADLTGHWEKRSLAALSRDDDSPPAGVDLLNLYDEYGGTLRDPGSREELAQRLRREPHPDELTDDFACLTISTKDELRRLFVERFYFGCEGDDAVMPSAFEANHPHGVRLRAVFGSDIGHWDVSLMDEVLEEVYEPVEKGLLTEADLREFLFANPVRLWTAANPQFFHGTAVEKAAAAAARADP